MEESKGIGREQAEHPVQERHHPTRRTLVIGHRGAPRRAPENTLASFAAALDLGVDGVEFDVHLSRDGIPVVIHDPTLERTTNGHGLVSDLTLAELRSLDAGAGERIPTLREVVDLVRGNVELQVEIKGTTPGMVAATVAVLRESGMLDATLVTSFHHALVREVREVEAFLRAARARARAKARTVREAEAHLRTGILISRGQLPEHAAARLQEAVNLALAARADYIDPHFTTLSPELIAYAHARGLLVATWTVDDPEEAQRLAAAGVDRLTTNVPDLVLAVLRSQTSGAER
ncbi:MAG: glycerophosphodiester phosphodiesterase [Chloroflexi bacterium]|nr:glycerophosphodiester phosphodiesterase [Chloroflexota bacterium]